MQKFSVFVWQSFFNSTSGVATWFNFFQMLFHFLNLFSFKFSCYDFKIFSIQCTGASVKWVWSVSYWELSLLPEFFGYDFPNSSATVHTFSWLLKSYSWIDGVVHAETGSGAKKRVVLWRENALHFLKVECRMVFEQKFAFSLEDFCSHAALWHWFFIVFFFKFFWSDYFLNGFHNSIIVHSWSSFYLVIENFLNCLSEPVLLFLQSKNWIVLVLCLFLFL